jgi:hypothetical protein
MAALAAAIARILSKGDWWLKAAAAAVVVLTIGGAWYSGWLNALVAGERALPAKVIQSAIEAAPPNTLPKPTLDSATVKKPAPATTADIMDQCVRNDRHPDAAEIIDELAQRFLARKFKYGWVAQTASAQPSSDVVWHDILDPKTAGDTFYFRIPWRNGRLRLVPVVKKQYSTRGHPDVSMVLQGMWSQDNGYGCAELIFDNAYEAEGRIGVMTASNLDTVAYIKRASSLP